VGKFYYNICFLGKFLSTAIGIHHGIGCLLTVPSNSFYSLGHFKNVYDDDDDDVYGICS